MVIERDSNSKDIDGEEHSQKPKANSEEKLTLLKTLDVFPKSESITFYL